MFRSTPGIIIREFCEDIITDIKLTIKVNGKNIKCVKGEHLVGSLLRWIAGLHSSPAIRHKRPPKISNGTVGNRAEIRTRNHQL